MTYFRLWVNQGQVIFVYSIESDELKHNMVEIAEPVGYKKDNPVRVIHKKSKVDSWYFRSPEKLDSDEIRKRAKYNQEDDTIWLPDEYKAELIEVTHG